MNLLDLLGQVQAITGGKFGLADLLSEEFVASKTNFSSIAELMKALPFDLQDMSSLQSLTESDLNDFVKQHASEDSWKDLLKAAVQFAENNK